MTSRILEPGTILCALRSKLRAALFLAAVSAAALALGVEAVRISASDIALNSNDLIKLDRAVASDPDNPALRHRLGMVRLYEASPDQASEGLSELRRATKLGPNEALYWSDLASACESSRDIPCASGAMARALALSPLTPRLYWSAGNYYLRQDQQDTALSLFHRLLQLDPEYALPTFQVCLHWLGNAQLIDNELLGSNPNPALALALVDFLSARGYDGDAYAAWRQLADRAAQAGAASPALWISSVSAYLNHIIDLGREREATAVWRDLERLRVIQAPDSLPAVGASESPSRQEANLVFNGGFESEPLNYGFDWRYQAQPFVSAGLSTTGPHGGAACLRIEFTAPRNDECEPLYQVVAVAPNQDYEVSAFVRTEEINSGSGPRLRVVDPFCFNCLHVDAEAPLEAASWRPVRLQFATGPATQWVKLSIWRPRSRAYPSEIKGVFWLDDVRLAPAPHPPAEVARRMSVEPSPVAR